MAGTFVVKTLAIGQLTGSAFYPIYIPGGSAVVKSIILVNTASTAVKVGLAIGATDGSTSARIIPTVFALDGNAMLETTVPYTFAPSFSLSGFADTLSVVDYSVHGVEEV